MSDLNRMRAEQEKLLTEVVYVQRLTKVSDLAGGYTPSWSTVATVKGRIALPKSSERINSGKEAAENEFIITLPHGTDVRQGDCLQISGQQYDVTGILRRSEQTAMRVICKVRQ